MLINPKYNEKEPKYDHKAARQRFTYQNKNLAMSVPLNTNNPIDTRLRQIALEVNPRFDFKKEFYQKWCVVRTIKGLRMGRIKDMFPADRLIRIKTPKDEDIIAHYEAVITVSERQP